MNIGIDMRLCGSRHGGIGRYSFEIAKNILETDSQSNYTLFFNKKLNDPKDIDFFASFSNAQIVITNARHYSFAEQTSFLRTLNKFNLDLVHFLNFNAPIFYKRPFVVTIHDVVHHKISGAKKSRLLHFFAYKKVMQSAADNALRIITVSEFSKQDIHQTLNVPLEKIVVTYEGPTLQIKKVSEEQVAKVKQYFLLKNPYLLFVGVLERKKNLVQLTRGFDEFIKKNNVNIDLVIVGKADKHYPDIKHHAADIVNKNHLVFTGYVEDSELAALYQGAYAFANASLHEGFGLPGIEAMQFGLPLLVSNIPVFNEIYDNAAVYFNPLDVNDIAEKMHLLVRDSQFYNEIRKHSLARAGLFNWKSAAKKTIEIYNNV